MCVRGLHASRRLIDALAYAPGETVCRVECGGEVVEGDDKLVCTERTILWRVDGASLLREFARWSALQVVHLWNPPQLVLDFLNTGDESLRDAASDAARVAASDAAWDAASDAAWDAARVAASDAAWDAASDAAWDAAWVAARAAASAAASDAAWDAAGAAASAAAWAAQEEKFTALVMAAHEKEAAK
jgi:hypothetical protein